MDARPQACRNIKSPLLMIATKNESDKWMLWPQQEEPQGSKQPKVGIIYIP